MDNPFLSLEAAGVTVTVDLRVGHLRRFTVAAAGRTLAPLHTAPWVDDPAIAADSAIPASLRLLSGDFFCAPFGASDLESGPAHGLPANRPWRHLETVAFAGGVTARFLLAVPVLGARLVKRLPLDVSLVLERRSRLPPWSGRHTSVLGVEEGRAFAADGHRASIAANALSAAGIPTALALDPQGSVEVRNVIGALPLGAGWSAVASVTAAGDHVRVVDASGARLAVPFDGRFLAAA